MWKSRCLCAFVLLLRNSIRSSDDSMRIGLVQACMLGTQCPCSSDHSSSFLRGSGYLVPLQTRAVLGWVLCVWSAYNRLSAVQFCSIIFGSSSLIAAAVVLLLTGACYGTSLPLSYNPYTSRPLLQWTCGPCYEDVFVRSGVPETNSC